MHITKVSLSNVKSYSEETHIRFESGVNLIKGENGAGKSTLLEAIGYALFDHLPYSQGDFIRKGARRGEISVTFVSAYDDREYEVTRRVGSSTYFVRDVETHTKPADGKQDTIDWLHEHLQIPVQFELSALFRDAIGVPQGTVTAAFLPVAASGREKVFNALLRVDGYKEAYSELGKTYSFINDLVLENEKSTIRLQTQLEPLPKRQKDIADIRQDINQRTDNLQENEQNLESTHQVLETQIQLKTQLDTLGQEIASRDISIQALVRLVSEAKENVDKAQDAKRLLETNETDYLVYQDAEKTLIELASKRKTRDELHAERQEADNERVRTETNLANVDEQLAAAFQATEQMQVLQPLIKEQSNLEEQQRGLAKKQAEREQRQFQIKSDTETMQALMSSITDLRDKLSKRNEIESSIESLRKQQNELHSDQVTAEAAVARVKEEHRELRLKLEHETKREQQHQAHQSSIAQRNDDLDKKKLRVEKIRGQLEERETLEHNRDQIDLLLRQAQGEKIAVAQRLNEIENTLTQLGERESLLDQDDSQCPVCQRSMDQHAREDARKHYDDERTRLLSEQKTLKQRVVELTVAIDEGTRELNAVAAKMAGLETNASLIHELQQVDRLKEEIDELKVLAESVRDAVDLVVALRQEEQALLHRLGEAEQRVTSISELEKRLTSDLNQKYVELGRLPQMAVLTEKEAELHILEDRLDESKRFVDESAFVDDQLEIVGKKLVDLADPRSAYQKASALAQNYSVLMEQSERLRKVLADCLHDIEQLDSQLRVFATLDVEAGEANAQKKRCAAGYQTYLENRQLGNSLASAIELFEQRQQLLATEREALQKVVEEHAALMSQYDAELHARCEEIERQLENAISSAKAVIETRRQELSKLEQEIIELEAIALRLQNVCVEGETLVRQASAFKFVRESIRDAGPKIRRRLVQSIADQANHFFREIMDDHRPTLLWNSDDYAVSVEQQGEQRSFQLLSGGEQMAAALSIRLALLSQLTEVRFVFLDEPTTNLDDKRRGYLATKLSQIQSLHQIFVISHDDTFEQSSQHTVMVNKLDGVSAIEVY